MRVRSVLNSSLFVAVTAVLAGGVAAQGQGAAQPGSTASTTQVHGTLIQVMRGVLLPASNVFFFAQSEDPAAVEPAFQAAISPNPLTSIYGGWAAVENSGITMAEAANLLTIPGRRCSNGRPVPIDNADWKQYVQELRDAGMASFKAAQAKDQDQVLLVAGQVTEACANCHNVYREKEPEQGGLAARCTK